MGCYFEAIRLNQEQSVEFLLVWNSEDRQFRKVMSLVSLPTHLSIHPTNPLPTQPRQKGPVGRKTGESTWEEMMVMAPGSGQIGLRALRAHPRTLGNLKSLVRCSELAKARRNKVCPSCPPSLFFPLPSSFLVTEL